MFDFVKNLFSSTKEKAPERGLWFQKKQSYEDYHKELTSIENQILRLIAYSETKVNYDYPHPQINVVMTSLTIKEVQELLFENRDMLTQVGAYGLTELELRKSSWPVSTLFSPEAQDAIALGLIFDMGLHYTSGSTTANEVLAKIVWRFPSVKEHKGELLRLISMYREKLKRH